MLLLSKIFPKPFFNNKLSDYPDDYHNADTVHGESDTCIKTSKNEVIEFY